MRALPETGEGRWRLDRHARLVVYEADAGDELVTVYDCGAAQKPPSAQFIGNLVRVRAPHEVERSPTGYVVTLREGGTLVEQGEDHYVIEEQ
ncbi:hypothetical protein B4589_001385 [Halolamina sp. CBA1230]|uniref:hypothetical protein n=1 Tax=Halolamina sp. CBA1230 TaxID=1853690 RepID=UPI0009A1C416|nr:hypothetical protein [Halolamina sp. CBA1230]QKY19091.1 hypothetical protein B4589_001385 [Halolamina sp. CBA1230]